jgi:PAS domain S-box-containing protein
MRGPSTHLFSSRLFAVAAAFGCTALAIILAKFHIQVPGTNSVTDPRELFVVIGAALTGPIGGGVIGILAGLGDPNANIRLYIIANHVLGAVWIGWAYKRLVHDRLVMPQMLLGWVIVVFMYYFIMCIPVIAFTKYLFPTFFAQIIPEPLPLFPTLMVFYRGWLVEFILTTALSSCVLLVLPRRARSPIWWTRKHPRVITSYRIHPARSIIALRLTLWVLILSCVPLVIMAVFLRTTLTRLYVEQAAEDELELMTAFVRSTGSDASIITFAKTSRFSFSDPLNQQFILDHDGRLAWHQDSTALYADARGVYGKALVERILHENSGYFYDEARERCYLYCRLHETPRWLVMAMDVNLSVAMLKGFERIALLQLGLALVLVAIIAGVVIWLIIGRPVKALATAARRVGRNDFQAHVDPDMMSDEVALLGQAFNEMAENLGILHRGLQTEIEDRRATEIALRKSERRFRELADLLPQTIYEADLSGAFLFTNRAASEMFRFDPSGPPPGISVLDCLAPEDRERARSTIARLVSGAAPTGNEYSIRRRDGTTFSGLIYSSIVRDGDKPTGLRGLVVDISEQRRIQQKLEASVAEKELMLKEIHHRVKNNLQIISSLLSLQSTAIQDPKDVALFGESVDRIRSMALIHDRLYKSSDLAGIEFREYIESLVTSLFHSYGRPSVKFGTNVQDVRLSIDTAIPFGLITNELVTNALKHAFPSGRQGEITVSLASRDDGGVQLRVADNGIGMPAGVDPAKTTSLGLQLVSILTQQLLGTLDIQRDGGTTISISIPPPPESKRLNGTPGIVAQNGEKPA